jgi:carbon monoxide dehydrogenase subunit G
VRVEAETTLPVRPPRAWAVLTDWERQSEWMRDAVSVRVLTSAREGVGVRVAVKTRIFGIPLFTEVLDVTVWEPPERLVVRHTGVVGGTGEWRFEPEGSGTRYRWIEDLSLGIPLIGGFALLAYRPFMRWLMRHGVEDLRRSLASPGGT